MFRLHRVLIAYAVAIPMALILGYLVATPDMDSIAVIGMVFFFLTLPLLIQWNHFLLIFLWNSVFVAGFLPGELPLWTIFAVLTFGMGVVHRVMGHRSFLSAPELTKPILMLATVVLVTMKVRGGLGLRAFGSVSFGGKHYFYVLAGILGYFALTSQPIAVAKSGRAAKWFFLSGLSFVLSNLIYVLGPAFYLVYFFVSPDAAMGQAQADFEQNMVRRFAGLGPCSIGLLCFVLARWGLRGVFQWHKPWRISLFLLAIVMGMFSGFRSVIALFGVLLFFQFFVEGLWKTGFFPAFALAVILCLAPVFLFANRMPMAIQRTLALLPVNIDPQVRLETTSSTEWRRDMWREVWPEVPNYLLVGKGYGIDPLDLYLTNEAVKMGIFQSYEESILAGDYHNGGLSVLMPFGIFGAIAFLWMLAAGIKVLYCNYRYGDSRLKSINAFLLSYFMAQCVIFFAVFGALDAPQSAFLGLLGLSVSLNSGVRRKMTQAKPNFLKPAMQPALVAA
jgi:hypothetical protein